MSNPGSLTTSLARLHAIADNLNITWSNTSEDWDDRTRHEIAAAHLEPLLRQVDAIIEATMPLGELLTQVRRACES
jgi:hypothetical protein